jgi:hypothetical protein
LTEEDFEFESETDSERTESTTPPDPLDFFESFPDEESDMSTTTATREIKIRPPTVFTGDRTKTEQFIHETSLFLRLNSAIYDTDEKKIVFALSFLSDGTASAWAQAWAKKEELGDWAGFLAAFRDSFAPIDDAGAARTEMKALRHGKDLGKYIAEFIMLKNRAGISDATVLIDYFISGLNPKLVDKIYSMTIVPETLDGVIKAATTFEGNWKRGRALIGKTIDSHEKKTTVKKEPPSTSLDINRLSQSERTEHMKKGLCFLCHKPGHRSSDHKGKDTPPRTPFFQKKRGEDVHANIRGMMAELDEEEKGKALRLLEESGF